MPLPNLNSYVLSSFKLIVYIRSDDLYILVLVFILSVLAIYSLFDLKKIPLLSLNHSASK
jgi:hypothetical protein